MRKTNKFVSLLVTVGMLISMMVSAVPTAGALEFTDVSSGDKYYDAIMNLAADGILNGFEDGSFKPEEPVTRAQFTKIICYAQNIGSLTYSEVDRAIFPDVATNHWAIDNIITAKNLGIINGYDDGTFKPDVSVLYEQAVKMVVCALGYTEAMAKREVASGEAYPLGYMSIASKKAQILGKITDAKIGQPLTRGGVAQLIDNMLGAKVYDPETGESSGTMKEETSSSKNTDGRVVGIHGASLYHDETSACKKNQIEVELADGSREFYDIEKLNISNLYDYLGRSVTVYYDSENGEYEAYNIVFQNKKNKSEVVNLDRIVDFNGSKLEYKTKNSGVVEDIRIASDAIVIYNGKAKDMSISSAISSFRGESGLVTLVCSDDNDVVDVALFNVYETIYVNSSNKRDYKIYDYYDASKFFVLDETDRSKKITFTKDGVSSSFSQIPKTCVVSVAMSEDKSIIDVQISTKTVTGLVSEITAEGYVRINSTQEEYGFADSCDKSVSIVPGLNVSLSLDAFGKIGRYTVTAEKDYTYGYLTAVEKGEEDDEIYVKIYKTSSSNTTASAGIFTLSGKVKIDGVNYDISKKQAEIIDYLESSATASNVKIGDVAPTYDTYAQPVRYTTSSSTVIDKIQTVNSADSTNNTLNVTPSSGVQLLQCTVSGQTLGAYIVKSSQTILVPSDRSSESYVTKSASYFKKGESYYVQIVNAGAENKPAVIYVYGTKSTGSDTTSAVISEDNVPMIVSYASSVMYEGSVRRCLTLINTSTGEEDKVYDDGRKGTEAALDVSVGDVIRVATDDKKLIDEIKIVANALEVKNGTVPETERIVHDGTSDKKDAHDAPLRTVAGLVHSASGNTIKMAASFDSSASTEYTYSCADSVSVYVIDVDAETVTEGTFGDIVDHVLVYTKNANVVAVIVFE